MRKAIIKLMGSDKMRKLLITGFEPFGGESINPSWEAVKLLPDKLADLELTKLSLPVTFADAAQAVEAAAANLLPDVILCIGQAGGRKDISVEFVGINLKHARIPDNAGEQPTDEEIIKGGRAAYFSTVPARKLVQAVNDSGIPASASYTAGTYVCNCVLYSLLAHFDGTNTKVGFIHIPYLPEQAKNGAPSMSIEDMVKALTAAITAL